MGCADIAIKDDVNVTETIEESTDIYVEVEVIPDDTGSVEVAYNGTMINGTYSREVSQTH